MSAQHLRDRSWEFVVMICQEYYSWYQLSAHEGFIMETIIPVNLWLLCCWMIWNMKCIKCLKQSERERGRERDWELSDKTRWRWMVVVVLWVRLSMRKTSEDWLEVGHHTTPHQASASASGAVTVQKWAEQNHSSSVPMHSLLTIKSPMQPLIVTNCPALPANNCTSHISSNRTNWLMPAGGWRWLVGCYSYI